MVLEHDVGGDDHHHAQQDQRRRNGEGTKGRPKAAERRFIATATRQIPSSARQPISGLPEIGGS
jgi:hypothetical protein